MDSLFLACGEKGDSDTADSEAMSQEDPNPQYIGGYNTNVCETLPESNGYAIGDVSYDFGLMDQHGEMVSLMDFCDNTVLLVSSAFWCGSCRAEAPELEALYQKYKDSDFTVITLIAKMLMMKPHLKRTFNNGLLIMDCPILFLLTQSTAWL